MEISTHTHSSKGSKSHLRLQERTLGNKAIKTPPPRVLLVHTLIIISHNETEN
jgi:hypothetical protein